MVEGMRERPGLFADVGQGCGIVRKNPDRATHERGTEVEKDKSNGPELAKVD